MRFDRRAPLVGACMRLHNFCIDRRIEGERLATYGSMTEVQPDRLLPTPHFDKDGRPVHFLDIERGERPCRPYRQKASQTRDRLVALIADKGLVRPPIVQRDGIQKQKKQKKRRGRQPKKK